MPMMEAPPIRATPLGLSLKVVQLAPSWDANSAPPGTVVATLRGCWNNGGLFTGSYPFVAPNFDDGGIYDVTISVIGGENIGNLRVAPGGPGVGSAATVENVSLVASQ